MKANKSWRKHLLGAKPKRKQPAKKSVGEATLAQQIRALKLPEPVRQYRPVKDRKFQVDFAWPELGLIVEVEGGAYMDRGAHGWGKPLEDNYRRHNRLKLEGWLLLQYSTEMVKSGEAIRAIEEYFLNLPIGGRISLPKRQAP